MARFMGGVQGQAGKATRLGSESSGIYTFANGWELGVKVYGNVDKNGEDCFVIYMTDGGSARYSSGYLATVRGFKVIEVGQAILDFMKEEDNESA